MQWKAQAAKVLALEAKSMKELEKEGSMQHEDNVHMLRVMCYHCGKEGHKLQITGIRILSVTPATRLNI